jgi:hypothetical protein
MTFVCIALVWLTGFSIARFLFPAPSRWSLHSVFLFSLGTGLGIGIASCLYFLSLVFFGPSPLILAGFGAIVTSAAILRGMSGKSRGVVLDWAAGPATPSYLTGLLLLAAAFAVTMFVVYSLEKPHGEWDAWSIWNLKARFLFRGGEGWKNALSTQMPNSHPDYPLLLPSIVAMCWTLARAESISAPIAVAFLFTLGACGLLISSIGILRGKAQALVAGIVLLATSSFIQLGAMQYADVPMSFYILATLALLCMQDRFPGDLRFSIAAGLTAGFAPWTKNEGWLFLAAVLLARLIAILRFETRTVLGPQFLRFASAALPSVALTAFFKLRFAPPNDLYAQKASDLVAHVAIFGRWIITLEGFVKVLFLVGGFLLPMVLILGLYWFLVRFHVEERERTSLATVLLAIGLMLAGEFAIYVVFPPDIVTQLNVSLERLCMQLWPAALLAFFLAANPPQLVSTLTHAAAKTKPGGKSLKPKRRTAPPKPVHPPVRLN